MTSRVLSLAVAGLALTSIACQSGKSVPAATLTPATNTSSAAELLERVKPSLVVVRYTFEGEQGTREFEGQGIVLDDDGTTAVSIGVVLPQFPDVQIKDFKLVIPGDGTKDETEIPAEFLGRDERTLMAYVRPRLSPASTKPVPTSMGAVAGVKWTPITFSDARVAPGDVVRSVGLLPKGSGYSAYISEAQVSALLRGPFPQVLVGATGLTGTGSPVFDAQGRAIGIVPLQSETTPFLTAVGRGVSEMAYVDSPPRMFLPAYDVIDALAHLPTEPDQIKLPTIGIPTLKGLSKDVAEVYGLGDQPAAQIGDVLPDYPAAKAGLKSLDIITELNGQPLQRGDSREEIPLILLRQISRLNPGDEITLTVISARGAEPRPVKLTLVERSMPVSKAPRYYAETLGFTVRGVILEDTYTRKLPASAKGVIVAFVRQQSAAATASLAFNDMVTKLNGKPVESVEQFKTELEEFRKAKPREAAVLEVLRGASTQVIRIEPPQE